MGLSAWTFLERRQPAFATAFPLFPDMPNPVPVTVELVNQLLYEEEASTD
jgi:hypothetical protein